MLFGHLGSFAPIPWDEDIGRSSVTTDPVYFSAGEGTEVDPFLILVSPEVILFPFFLDRKHTPSSDFPPSGQGSFLSGRSYTHQRPPVGVLHTYTTRKITRLQADVLALYRA